MPRSNEWQASINCTLVNRTRSAISFPSESFHGRLFPKIKRPTANTRFVGGSGT